MMMDQVDGWKFDERRTKVGRKLDGGNMMNNITNTMMLQSACELHSDDERNAMATTLWNMRELCNDGEWQHDEHRIVACVATL